MHCERHDFTGLSVDGGFAEYVLVDERSLVKLPPGVEPAAVAPHADAGLTAYHAVRTARALCSAPGRQPPSRASAESGTSQCSSCASSPPPP